MSPITDQVDELFAGWNKPDSPGCALAVIQDGEIIYQRGYGMADLERNVPISPASIFDIGSTGKQFTAMLVAILAKQGLLSLDDRVQKHIPELPSYEQPITIRHLIYHTSGLRDYTTLMALSAMPFENFYYEDQLLDLICRQTKINFRPGDEFLYSNTGYFLLGVLAGRVAGKSLTELIREVILQPLGMQATSFNDDARRIVKNRAIGYSLNDQGAYSTEMSFCGGYGDGAIISSVEDLYLWDQNFYANKLGGDGDELIHELLTPGELNSGEKLDYAMGLLVENYRGLRKVSHDGDWAGYRSEMIRFPEQRLSVICLTNFTRLDPSRLAQKGADLYLAGVYPEREPIPGSAETEAAEPPAGQIERILGSYRNLRTGGDILQLSTEQGRLVAEIFGLRFPLIATSPTHFQAVESPFDFHLDLEEPGSVNPPTLSVQVGTSRPRVYQKIAVVPLDRSQLADYPGVYHSEELNILYQVRMEPEQLSLKRGYSPSEALRPVSADLFTCSDLDLQFERDEHNRVRAFRIGAGRVRDIRFIRQ